MMFRVALILSLILVLSAPCLAQYDYVSDSTSTAADKKKKPFILKENLVYAGNVGLAFGNITYVQASPMVGVKIKPDLTAGVGVDYIFYGAQGFRNQSLYGGSLWSRYFVTNNIFLTSQYQVMNRELFSPREGYYRANVNMLFLGGGILLGERNGFSMTISGMFDVIEDPNSPFTNPIIRVGTAIGF